MPIHTSWALAHKGFIACKYNLRQWGKSHIFEKRDSFPLKQTNIATNPAKMGYVAPQLLWIMWQEGILSSCEACPMPLTSRCWARGHFRIYFLSVDSNQIAHALLNVVPAGEVGQIFSHIKINPEIAAYKFGFFFSYYYLRVNPVRGINAISL